MRKINYAGLARGVKSSILKNNEELAKKRASICAGCEFNVPEENSFFRVKDKNKLISERKCAKCDCSLHFLTRDRKSKCEFWDE